MLKSTKNYVKKQFEPNYYYLSDPARMKEFEQFKLQQAYYQHPGFYRTYLR
jgi:hypothetical protein